MTEKRTHSSAATDDAKQAIVDVLRPGILGEHPQALRAIAGEIIDSMEAKGLTITRTFSPAQSVGMREALEEIQKIGGPMVARIARDALAAQPPAATVETGRHISCAPGGKPYADSHNGSSAGTGDELAGRLRRYAASSDDFTIEEFGLLLDAADALTSPSAGNGEDLAAKLKEAHQQKLALWQAIAGGPEPRCRDCADFDGRCQGDGLPCDPQERALERIARLRAVPQSAPVTQSAAALAERLIQAAVDYESGRCSKRELAEARAAVETAIKPSQGDAK